MPKNKVCRFIFGLLFIASVIVRVWIDQFPGVFTRSTPAHVDPQVATVDQAELRQFVGQPGKIRISLGIALIELDKKSRPRICDPALKR